MYMAVKSANLYARIEPELKEEAESILAALGIPASNAITMFYRQIILQRGMPFEVKLPAPKIPMLHDMTEEDLNRELEKGYADMVAGHARDASEAFDNIRQSRA
jgi:addiction module antitoxin, relB/dinJ family